jgi:signal transduction histidine kinase/CheY-like chemotaxis protein
VGDEARLRERLEGELASHGHHPAVAAGGAEAIERVRASTFDVVLSDLEMPGVDGLAVLRESKIHAPDTEVVITGHAGLADAIACVRGGAFDFVAKPFKMADLMSTVDRAVVHRHARRTRDVLGVTDALASKCDPQQLLAIFVEEAANLLAADNVALLVPDGDRVLRLARSGAPERGARAGLPECEKVALEVAEGREPKILSSGRSNKALDRVGSSIVFPLLARGGLRGVLVASRLGSRPTFRRGDLARVAGVAAQLALTLDNAALQQQLVASERLATLGHLAASVAHEINNPLSHLLGTHELLLQDLTLFQALGDQLERGADVRSLRRLWRQSGGRPRLDAFLGAFMTLGESARRIHDIAQDMRSMARRDCEAPSVIDVNDAVSAAMRVLGRDLRRVGNVTADLGSGVRVLAHLGRISQIVVNLLANAVQALGEPRRANGRVVVTTERRDGTVRIAVRDNAGGIGPRDLARVFEPYFTTKGPTSGTGLGLSISREIARGYGGDITVDSAPGFGATFTVTLPAFPVEPATHVD